MSSFLIPIFILVLSAFALSLLFRRTLVETFPIAASIVVICLYAGGFVHNLWAGVVLTILVSIGIWAVCWRKGMLQRQQILEHLGEWRRSLAVILPMLVLILLMTEGLELSHTDEYSHWGTAVKDMVLSNELYCSPDSHTDFKDYMPGISLFEYFFCVFGRFRSQNIFRGMDVLMMAAMLPSFKSVVKKEASWLYIPLGWLALLGLLYGNYANAFSLLQVDAALAIFLAGLLFNWFGDERKDLFAAISVSLSALVLTMAKGSGIALAFLGFLVIAADAFLIDSGTPQEKRNGFRCLGAAVATTICSWLSWKVCTALYGVSASRSQGNGMAAGIAQILRGDVEPYQTETVRNFVKTYLFGQDSGSKSGVTCFQWVILLALFAVLVGAVLQNRKRLWLLVIAMPAMHLLYSAMLLITYMVSFTEAEAVSLASLFRYMPSCYLGCLLFMMEMLLLQTGENRPKERRLQKFAPVIAAAVIGLLLPVQYLIQGVFLLGYAHNEESRRFVEPYRQLRQLSETEAEDTLVYLIGKMTYPYTTMVSTYELLPLRCEAVHIGEYENAQELKEKLLQADYLYVLPYNVEPYNYDGPVFQEDEIPLLPENVTTEKEVLYKIDAEHGTFIRVEP